MATSTGNQNTWDTVKAYILLADLFLFITACLLFAVRKGEFSGFLLLLCLALFGFHQGL